MLRCRFEKVFAFLPVLFSVLSPVLSFVLSLGVAARPSEAFDAADLFFHNGVICTMDADDRLAGALAVKDGKIVFVGSPEDGEKYKGPETRVVDLGGKLMLPGFLDTHIHSPGIAMGELFDFVLAGVYDTDKIAKTIRDYVDAHPQEAYFGFGFESGAFGEDEKSRGPTKERLDAICPDRPIQILAGDGHSMWLNSKAFEAAGITESTVSPHGGIIEKDGRTGALWGTLKDMAMTLARRPAFDIDKTVAALKKYQEMLNSYGCTSIFSVPMFGDILDVPWEALHRMDEAGGLTVKVRAAVIFDSTADLAEKEREIGEIAAKYNGKYLKLTSAKFFADGVVNTRTAFMLAPYDDRPDSRGVRMWDQNRLNEAFAKVNGLGLQAHIHAIGDAAVRAALDACEYANAHAPKGDCRNTVTHLQVVDPADLGRFKALGVVASTQPYWHFKIPEYWEPEEYKAIGARAEREYPLKSLHDAGATLAFSSDSPVTPWPNPLVAIQAGVTRNLTEASAYGLPDLTDIDDPTYLLNAAERLPVREMIRGFTANGAYATFAERETGTLEVGKAADLIVLDRNILEIDPLQIGKAKVLQTYLDGKLVYGEAEEKKSSSSGCDASLTGLLALCLAAPFYLSRP